MKRYLSKGFTLIELLIVIAVLGILAVAVLAAINPIEQINRSRDTGNRSDAEQLLGAIDRFYASQGYYPWKTEPEGSDALAWTPITDITSWVDGGGENVLDKLAGGTGTTTEGAGELKESFTSRITGEGYNNLYVWNEGGAGDSTYICFNGASQSFQKEASDRCNAIKGSIPADLESSGAVCGVTIAGETDQYLTCLP
jgi:prepilin-type N-terminal cleavage/methylation domain-containing protein